MSHGEGARGPWSRAGMGPRERFAEVTSQQGWEGQSRWKETAVWQRETRSSDCVLRGWASGIELGRGGGPQELRPGLWKGVQIQ